MLFKNTTIKEVRLSSFPSFTPTSLPKLPLEIKQVLQLRLYHLPGTTEPKA